ncbi:MAG TPA: NAD(P)/FAD-dependent oxidoreductase [Flavobacteriales bacterium]|nr:NAD(P)/FAD-dependent oxidoreductase [Flavobacteriales bacterium]HIK68226.1 NAD(P)/FAD-dependent oxidoreductase [Flavobacteriales bacterium]
MKVAIIGGGAAGFFSAFSVKEHHPNSKVTIFEKSNKLLSKVKVSGGGRCNVTNACFSPSKLSKSYPRGGKHLKKSFSIFQTKDTVEWFSKRGVELKAEEDGRMFPTTDNSQTIIDCFLKEAAQKNIKILEQSPIRKIVAENEGYTLHLEGTSEHFDKVIIATGGSPKMSGFYWLQQLGHSISPPLPSLFTFNIPGDQVKILMGLVVENATVRIQGTKLSYSGPVLITHWGMSGPAILKLSAWGARKLAENNYNFNIQINWLSIKSDEAANEIIDKELLKIRKKKIINACPFELPNRMWKFLLEKVEINPDSVWLDLSKKNRNKLLNILLNDIYEVKGKTTFKEEFVTCGGIKLSDISMTSMESRVCKNLYFAGEVLDIDGITGGFNFQGAWTTGYIAGKLQS